MKFLRHNSHLIFLPLNCHGRRVAVDIRVRLTKTRTQYAHFILTTAVVRLRRVQYRV